MNKAKKSILFFLSVLALLGIPTFVVFAKELGLLTISGPGIGGELTLTGPDQWGNLEDSGFFAQENIVKQAPENLGQGYTLTAGLDIDGKMIPFVEMAYYPAKVGQPGYFHYTARLNGETLQHVDEWGRSTLSADKAFRSLMAANNVTLQSALLIAPAAAPAVEVELAPTASPAPTQTSYLIPVVIAALLLFGGVGLILRRRIVSPPTM